MRSSSASPTHTRHSGCANSVNQKGFIAAIVIAIVVALLGAGTYFVSTRQISPSPKACTQEAKLCPDGSYVSRTGPDCEFAECPDGEQISLREGQRESSFLLEKIYPDRVTGLNFMEYPVARDQGYPVTLRIGEVVSNGCTVTLTLAGRSGAAEFPP